VQISALPPSPAPDFYARLRERHLLPVLTGWFGLSWALVEVAGFLVERYGAPERLIDAVFVAMWAFLPLVAMLTWWIGAPGPTRWTRRRVALAVLLFALGGVVVVKTDLRSSVAPPLAAAPVAPTEAPAPQPTTPWVMVFPFSAAATLPEAERWVAGAIHALAEYDLAFDPRLRAASAVGLLGQQLQSQLRLRNARDIDSSPLAARLQAARALGFQAVVVGSVDGASGNYRIVTEVHRLGTMDAPGRSEAQATDPWDAVDQVAASVRAILAVPGDSRAAPDPPLKSVTTESADALRDYAAAARALGIDSDPARGRALLEAALALDPGFVLADSQLQSARSMLGEAAAARAGMEALEPRLGVLPDRMRYATQVWLARVRDQPGQIRQVYEIWSRQWPADREPRLALARLDLLDDPDNEAAWQALREATVDGGSVAELASLARALLLTFRVDEAAELVALARERDPADASALLAAADIENVRGNPDAALALIDEAALRRPDLQAAPAYRVQHALRWGDWRGSLRQLEALRRAVAKDPVRLAGVHRLELLVLQRLGRLEAMRAVADEQAAIERARQSPALYFQNVAAAQVGLRAQIDGADAARAWALAALKTDEPLEADYAAARIDLTIALALRDYAGLAAAIERSEQVWHATGAMMPPRTFDLLRAVAAAGQRGDAASLAALEEAFRIERQRVAAAGSGENLLDSQLMVIDQALANGDAVVAARWLEPLQRARAGSPEVRWRSARLADLRGDGDTVRRELPPLLEAWAEADPAFEEAGQARELAARHGLAEG
jgi:hypothetical protein